MRTVAILATLIVAGGAGASLAEDERADFLNDVRAYQEATARVCETGVTPEMTRLHGVAERGLADARYGGGVRSNFFGLQTPDELYRRCVQSPGFR